MGLVSPGAKKLRRRQNRAGRKKEGHQEGQKSRRGNRSRQRWLSGEETQQKSNQDEERGKTIDDQGQKQMLEG